jgi:hypothetical protein
MPIGYHFTVEDHLMGLSKLFSCATCSVIWLWTTTSLAANVNSQTHLRHYLVEVAGFDGADLKTLRSKPVVRELKVSDKSRGLALVAAVKIDASRQDFLAATEELEDLFGGKDVLQFGRFSNPPVLADLAALQIPQEDIEVLAKCKLAECKFKLGKTGLEAASKFDWGKPDAGPRFTALVREGIIDYLNGYRAEGNSALIEYADKSTPFKLADGFRHLLGEAKYFHKLAPELADYLLAFPDQRPEGAQDAFYWSVTETGYRPTTVLGHLVVYQTPQLPIAPIYLVIKQIYASHYFGARLTGIAFMEEKNDPQLTGNYLVGVDRVLFDDKLGRFKRGMLSGSLLKRVASRLEEIRGRIENVINGRVR